MDWRQVDLTLEGQIGGIDHPDMPWELRRQQSEGDLYTHIFREHRIDGARVLQIIDDYELDRHPIMDTEVAEKAEESAANIFMEYFGRFPNWLTKKNHWMKWAIGGGDCCDRCGMVMNLLNSANRMCCDQCEIEMSEQMAASPDVVFAFERGGLRAVA